MDESSPLEEINVAPPHILGIVEDLRVLFFNLYNSLPFLLALNPDWCPSKQILCPKLESAVLYVDDEEALNIRELVDTARERASRGAQLQSITVIGGDRLVPEEEVFKLREHVACVECRFEMKRPRWNKIPDHGNT